MFVNTTSGKMIALSAITSIGPENKDKQRVIYFGKGDHEVVYVPNLDRAIKQAQPLIPAVPGTYMVRWDFEDGKEWFSTSNVVGWRIDEYGIAHPVDPWNDDLEDENFAILFPDGKVVRTCLQQWDSFDDFKKDMREQHERYLEQQARKMAVPLPWEEASDVQPFDAYMKRENEIKAAE